VEEAPGKAVSNAYLSQLENGKIKKPSLNVLHSLAEVYAVPYETLMEEAGYLLPAEDGGGHRKRLAAFAIEDLTAEEEEELLKYLAFLRSHASSCTCVAAAACRRSHADPLGRRGRHNPGRAWLPGSRAHAGAPLSAVLSRAALARAE